jgi:hypothetical protein
MRSVTEDPALIYVVAICNLSRAYIPLLPVSLSHPASVRFLTLI